MSFIRSAAILQMPGNTWTSFAANSVEPGSVNGCLSRAMRRVCSRQLGVKSPALMTSELHTPATQFLVHPQNDAPRNGLFVGKPALAQTRDVVGECGFEGHRDSTGRIHRRRLCPRPLKSQAQITPKSPPPH